MKRTVCVIIMLLLLCGCRSMEKADKTEKQSDTYVTGVWLSYSEVNELLSGDDFISQFDTVVKNCKDKGITDMFVHVRAFCDSVYPSKYYPLSRSAEHFDGDALKIMINACHKNNIRFHAWINPYRVRTADCDVSSLDNKSPAYIWLNDENGENDSNVCISNGIYLNPSSSEVRQLIIDGIREILLNYQVDGIHFDDYFYPTTDGDFDSGDYNKYCENNNNPLSLAEFRTANVNALISGVYTAVKFINKDIIFSISPAAGIEKNKNEYYADVASWINSGCIDYIIPQLYFGFLYPDEDFRFDKLVDDWSKLCTGKDVKLLIGLSLYKIGTDALPDREEWVNGNDVIERQIKICKENKDIKGHIFFSYSDIK